MSNALFWVKDIADVADALDTIDPQDVRGDGTGKVLAEGDVAVQFGASGEFEFYIAHNSAGAAESLPDVVLPNTNTGNWWWEKISQAASGASVPVGTRADYKGANYPNAPTGWVKVKGKVAHAELVGIPIVPYSAPSF